MFQVGDKIVHPMHGAGIVESIVQKKVNGVMRDYYVLKLPVRAMVVMIPTDNSEEIGVRPIVDREQADRVLEEIGSLQVEMTQNWNRRYRENMERLKSGDLLEVARQRQVKVVLVSRFPKSPGGQLADVVLQCGADEGPLQAGSVNARMAQLFVLDVLFQEFCMRAPEETEQSREQIAEAVARKHL